MKWLAAAVGICLLIPVHLTNLHRAAAGWEALARPETVSHPLPAPVAQLASLEFDGLASDYLFLEAMVFWGRILEKSRQHRYQTQDWEFRNLYGELLSATDLDPYFLDPYLFAQAILVWEAKMYDEVNALLSKGERYRDWDWQLPFYKGFNYFYFLKDNEKASASLMTAARKPDAFPLLASLATRLAVKGKQTENAILFLDQVLRNEEDPERRAQYELRLLALQQILFLERAVGKYAAINGKRPSSLRDLVSEGYVAELPKDPYGGVFYLTPEGEIKTSSNMQVRK